MGISENRLAQELRAFQAQRTHQEMWVPISLEDPKTGKSRTIKGLLDNGCTTTCMDRDYAKAQAYELTELDVEYRNSRDKNILKRIRELRLERNQLPSRVRTGNRI